MSATQTNPMKSFIEAPRFPLEKFEAELANMTEKERAERLRDLFPTLHGDGDEDSSSSSRQNNNGDDGESSIRVMWNCIHKKPISEWSVLLDAAVMCPHEFSSKRLSLFLEREDMDPSKAAKRLIAYWKRRQELFGPDKWHLPMTQDGALRDDSVALRKGCIEILPRLDAGGRPIIMHTSNRHTSQGYTTQSLMRADWYMFEKIVEMYPDTAPKGIVCLVDFQNWKFIDRAVSKARSNVEHEQPVRICAIHVVHIPRYLRMIVKPIVFFFVNKRMRTRICFHDDDSHTTSSPASIATEGNNNMLLESLTEYGLTAHMLPTNIGGGTVVLDHVAWLEEQRIQEQQQQHED